MPFALGSSFLPYLLHQSNAFRTTQEKKLGAMLAQSVCSFVLSGAPSSEEGATACVANDGLFTRGA